MDSILEEHNALPEDYGLNSPRLLGLKGKRKKVANNIGKVQKRESNVVLLNDDKEGGSLYDKM